MECPCSVIHFMFGHTCKRKCIFVCIQQHRCCKHIWRQVWRKLWNCENSVCVSVHWREKQLLMLWSHIPHIPHTTHTPMASGCELPCGSPSRSVTSAETHAVLFFFASSSYFAFPFSVYCMQIEILSLTQGLINANQLHKSSSLVPAQNLAKADVHFWFCFENC